MKSWTDNTAVFRSGMKGVVQKTPLAATGKIQCVGVIVSVNSKRRKKHCENRLRIWRI